MPTYLMHCESCGKTFERVRSIHDGPPTESLCEKVGEVVPIVQILTPPIIFGVGASGSATALKDANAKQRERDVAAYKRLRQNGVQPATVADSAEIEARANEPIEVERNTAFEHKGLRRRMQAAANEAAVTQAVA